MYGGRPFARALTGYVELMRGTPVLLQLFVIYYGLAAGIRLPAFVAALLGLGAELRRRTRAKSTAARSRPCRADSSKRRARSGSASARSCGSCADRRRSGLRSRR